MTPFPEAKCGTTFIIRTRCLSTLSILENLYKADNYTLLDGDKSATVQALFGTKQGSPLSPLLFSIYLNDINSVTDGAQGAVTGIPGFTVKNMLFADDLFLPSNEYADLQTMLNLPPLYCDGEMLPYTDVGKNCPRLKCG
jgi:hypothetical protein